MNPVRWGVLGAGWLVNQATAQAIHSATGAVLQATAARDIARAEATQPVRAYSSYDHLLEDPDVDAVYICLHNDAHLPWILAAAAAGKHVLCEKPLTLSAADTARAFAAADEAGVLLVEAAWSRWHPRVRRVIELAGGGSLGDVQAFLGTFTFPSVPEGNYRMQPEHGGGALYDVGIYPLHVLLACLADAEALEVVAADADRADTGVDLTTRATLAWGESSRGAVAASFTMPESQRLTVRGSEGVVTVDDDRAFTSWRESAMLRVGDHVEAFGPVDAYEVMFAEVSSAIRGEGGWVLRPRDSQRVAAAVDAIRAASRDPSVP